MQYVKHYWVNNITDQFCCRTNDAPEKRHPVKEIPGLGVKVWLQDVDGIDVCLSEVPDGIPVPEMYESSTSTKKCVQVLTETEYNSVATPYFESQQLSGEARMEEDETLKAQKEAEATAKYQEAVTALHAL
jgi:hypothetical protein